MASIHSSILKKHGFENYRFFDKLIELPFVDAVILYGSRARGDFRERSDIDLAIEAPRATSTDWHRVLQLIDDADTLLQIDCVRLDHLAVDEPLRCNVEKEGVVLFQRKPI